MATPPVDPAALAEAVALVEQHGTIADAARASGIPRTTLSDRYAAAKRDPAIAEAMAAANTNMVPALAWVKTKDEDGTSYSVLLKPQQIDDTLDRIRAALEGMKPAKLVPGPRTADKDLLTLYPLADVHIGMMAWGRETGEDYNTRIACDRVTDWIGRCVASSPASETAVILDVGDLLHADDQTAQTPKSKNRLDVDSRFYRTVDLTIAAMAASIDTALQKHKRVIVRILPGNHDPHASIAICFALAERYRNDPRVEVAKDPSEFWVYEWGRVLLAAHHGDKAKAQQMVLYLADRWPEVWGKTAHRYLFTGHLHHHKSADIGGVQWEQLRAVTAKDAYASSHAYSARAQLQGITYQRDRGEVQRVKVGM